jgi:drug/metabolite transporter (DMT)-like permease
MTTLHARGVFWMAVSSVMFSLMSVMVRISGEIQGLNAWKITQFRFILSIVFVLGLAAWQHCRLRFVNRSWLVSRGLLGGAAVFVFFYTVTRIGIAKATILSYTYPVWAGLFAPWLLGDRLRPGVIAAVLTALAGLYLVIVPDQGIGQISWVDLFGLTGGVLSGWAVLAIKRLRETDSPQAILFSQSLFGLLIVAGPAQAGGYSVIPAAGWCALLALGLFATAGQLQMTYAYKHVGATEGSLLGMLTPVISVPLGLIVFHEPVSARALVGCGIVLIACAYAALPPRLPPAEITGL